MRRIGISACFPTTGKRYPTSCWMTFTAEWGAWARARGALIRNQAHGSPANILGLFDASAWAPLPAGRLGPVVL
jgi:hypothetical protein